MKLVPLPSWVQLGMATPMNLPDQHFGRLLVFTELFFRGMVSALLLRDIHFAFLEKLASEGTWGQKKKVLHLIRYLFRNPWIQYQRLHAVVVKIIGDRLNNENFYVRAEAAKKLKNIMMNFPNDEELLKLYEVKSLFILCGTSCSLIFLIFILGRRTSFPDWPGFLLNPSKGR